MKQPIAIFVALSLFGFIAQGQDAAPDREFERIAEHVAKDAPSADLVDRVYEFMEKYPKDPRCDRLQYWAGIIQQKRKFHNEAIKELGFVVSDFPKSPLVLPAMRAQAESYDLTGRAKEAGETYKKIVDQKPASVVGEPEIAAAVRDAIMYLAKTALEAKDVDGAIKYYLQLPDRTQAITFTVQIYIQAERHEEALAAIGRLDEADRFLAYRLTAVTYGSRNGVANLLKLLERVIEKEKPSAQADNVLEQIVKIFHKKTPADEAKALEIVAKKYERLRRWAHYSLCQIFKLTDPVRLRTFIGDYRTGVDVEQTKNWLGAFFEAAGDVKQAQDAYWLLDDKVAAHFLVAETYYGQRAKTKDLAAGAAELSAIVKRYYSPISAADALSRRGELEATLMKNSGKAIKTFSELVDRFPREGMFAQNGLMRLGTLYRGEKKYDEAISMYEKLIIQYPDGSLLRPAWLAIAFTHEEKQDPKRAMEVLKSILRKYPRTSEASVAHTRLEVVYKLADTEISDR